MIINKYILKKIKCPEKMISRHFIHVLTINNTLNLIGSFFVLLILYDKRISRVPKITNIDCPNVSSPVAGKVPLESFSFHYFYEEHYRHTPLPALPR